MKSYKLLATTIALSTLLFSCTELEDFSFGKTNIIIEETPFEIPSNDDVEANPEIEDGDESLLSNISTSREEGYDNIIRINITGIMIPGTTDWLLLYGPLSGILQNIWIEINGTPRGFTVINSDDEQDSSIAKSKADIVFLVDNSGSMSTEANAIAEEIVEWSESLADLLDVEFGCVGYDGNITGAINMTTVDMLDAYLNATGKSGTSHTVGFSGDDAAELSTLATELNSATYGECGMCALRYADENFTFRNGSNRIYINFTDEPNQPYYEKDWSVEYLNGQENWNTSQGTVHTVYSGSTNYTSSSLYNEYPWLMSEYTGGTTMYASSSFSGVTLADLTVTGAIQHSAYLRIVETDDLSVGTHTVKLTVLSEAYDVKSEKTYENVSFEE
ncbi:MAG: VWA domain-containing protein [Rikenellaceae bacterium]